jgi:hypothetical protein
MKVGIMQPYFFPYFGYFQLINEVDVYVNLDHVSFMKRSFMTRNKIKNETSFNIPILNGTQNKSCKEIFINVDERYINTIINTFKHLYGKELFYDTIIKEIFNDFDFGVSDDEITISDLNLFFIKKICNYLDIKTKIINTSLGLTDKKKGDGLIDITHQFSGDTYINAIGGQKIYNKEYFKNSGIILKFIKISDVDFDDPYTSILDLLFRYEKHHIINQLPKFELI